MNDHLSTIVKFSKRIFPVILSHIYIIYRVMKSFGDKESLKSLTYIVVKEKNQKISVWRVTFLRVNIMELTKISYLQQEIDLFGHPVSPTLWEPSWHPRSCFGLHCSDQQLYTTLMTCLSPLKLPEPKHTSGHWWPNQQTSFNVLDDI